MKKKFLLMLTVMAASLLLLAVPVQAQAGVQATLTPQRSELTVGDPVQLTLEVAHPADVQVIIPKLEPAWGRFEVREQSQAETVSNSDGASITRQTLTVTLFEPGTFETPALPLTISDNSGQVNEITTTPVSLTVVPVLAEGDTTLKDIRPQAGMDIPSMLPLAITALVVAALAAAAGWWLYRRWRSGRLGQIVDNRPPYQVAFDELAHIAGMKLPEKNRFKTHYTLVTDVLRTYIEKQFQVHAFDRTTTELKQSLAQSTMNPEHGRQFIDLFMDSDLVKFAKITPTIAEAYQTVEWAGNLVEATRPKLEAEAAGAPKKPLDTPNFQTPVEAA